MPPAVETPAVPRAGLAPWPMALLAAVLLAGCHGEHGGRSLAGATAEINRDQGSAQPVSGGAQATPSYSIGGTVSGLRAGRPLRLTLNGGTPLEVAADGAFTFPEQVEQGQSYQVSVAQQPFAQACTVTGGSGTATEDVSDVQVSCADQPTLTVAAEAVRRLRFTWPAVEGATHYRILEDPDGASGYTQLGADVAAPATETAAEVPLLQRLNARYLLRACDGAGCVDSAPVSMPQALAQAAGYFKASNAEGGDAFGYTVALSADGATLAVGAPYEDGGNPADPADNSASTAGAVYVFVKDAATGTWSQQAYLKAANAGAGDRFGDSLALSADGATLAVGAYREDGSATGVNGTPDDGASDAGAVYVFVRDGSGSWSQEAYVKASNTQGGDRFGVGLALSADGATLAVGAPYEDSGDPANPGDNSATRSGAVYVFTRSGGSWSQAAYLKASTIQGGDHFGQRVALDADGRTLAVSATGEDSAATGIGGDQGDNGAPDSGAVYVFARDPGTGAWSQEAYVKASNTGPSDVFGAELALSDDGRVLAVAATGEDSAATGIGGAGTDDDAPGAGAVYVFSKDPDTGAWSQEAYVKAVNTASGDAFGDAVALSGDGQWLAVGATGEDGSGAGPGADPADDGAVNAGAVYLYRREAGGWVAWLYLKAPTPDDYDLFGEGLALDGSGGTLAAGAVGEQSRATGVGGDQTDNGATVVGAVFLY